MNNISEPTRDFLANSDLWEQEVIHTNKSNLKDLKRKFDSSLYPSFIVDENLRFTYYNQAFLQFTANIPKSEKIIGKTISDLVPNILNTNLKDYQKVIDTKTSTTIQKKIDISTNDSYSIKIIPLILDSKSGISGMQILTIMDLYQPISATVRILEESEVKFHQTIDALQASEQKYRNLIQNMGEGVWVTNLKNSTIFVNPAICEMLNYSERHLMSGAITDFLSKTSHILFNEVIQNKLSEEGRNKMKSDFSFLKRSGEILNTRATITAIKNQDGQMTGVFAVITDITREKRFQELQERFIAITSHELRNPVTSLLGSLEFLMSSPNLSIKDREKFYTMMSRNSFRLKSLIEAFHDLSTIRADLFRLRVDKVILDSYFEDVKSQVQLLFPNRIILFNISLPDINEFHFDPDRINQVIENLVSNAVKNSPSDTIINININFTDGSLRISVEDRGVGITNQNLLKLFQPFSHIPTTFSKGGTGLGLYIVKYVVNLHGGFVGIDTQENLGSTFTISLPKKIQPELADQEKN